ncbi:MAG TPA: acyl-CoA dehydratase activase [Deltaproteobacteria bacterium]|nr:acyl-CoA dehydratase activase [Deltaproteobacteria bacterium]HQI80293.1 acyl-CoA dehydratase activase [Deltaproteobacteria bacterium]
MYVAGCDVGSLSAKAVIMKDDNIVASHIMFARPEPSESARVVMEETLRKVGLSMEDIACCVGTGYGRNAIPFAQACESEIACHGKAAQWLKPQVRMVIDIGGQDAKAIRVDETGTVVRYAYNDRCASGTGRFLEVMAGAMGIDIEAMGDISAQAREPVTLSNQCVVFAETEIISLINAGRELPDIVGGLHRALSHRVASLARSIELEGEITMTGGVAKNRGMFTALEEALGVKLVRMDTDPQIIGAVGAALMARQTAAGNG